MKCFHHNRRKGWFSFLDLPVNVAPNPIESCDMRTQQHSTMDHTPSYSPHLSPSFSSHSAFCPHVNSRVSPLSFHATLHMLVLAIALCETSKITAPLFINLNHNRFLFLCQSGFLYTNRKRCSQSSCRSSLISLLLCFYSPLILFS